MLRPLIAVLINLQHSYIYNGTVITDTPLIRNPILHITFMEDSSAEKVVYYTNPNTPLVLYDPLLGT